MRQSELFTKTLKSAPREEPSVNAQFLTRGGFVYKNSAGVYTFLPLGWRVAEKIHSIIREEMAAIGAIEMFMPSLVERNYLDASGRFDVGIAFDVRGKKGQEVSFVLGWTHEEVIAAIAAKYVNSYKDLPFAVYQIQTKFRNEPRPKSGLLRCREFLMKDLYSFHATEKDFLSYYKKVAGAYRKIFTRCGLDVFYTLAGGGTFTAHHTHEFQVLAPLGEDTIWYCQKCRYAENQEISKLKEGKRCPECKGKIKVGNAIEVGNIFPLGTKYSQAFRLFYRDKAGQPHAVVMGSYGIGIGRTMGAIVESHHDEKGIIWPREVAPFSVHLIGVNSENLKIQREANTLYSDLQKQGVEVLYDDRGDKSAGEKFADADLIGIPLRVLVSDKTLRSDSVELKKRAAKDTQLMKIRRLLQFLRSN